MCTNHGEDRTKSHAWLLEDPIDSPSHVLTRSGLQNIAAHKYKPGDYTHLDTFLNPMWNWLTELLPMWLAPNMVTTMGGLHCGLSYATQWYYSPELNSPVPDWVMILSGYCTIAYYTLDCMDGKQARRTGTSSPLGQLFDHGFDCICILSHCASAAGWSRLGGSLWYFVMQCSLQFAFFTAQWEEYYTGILPHATGKFVGVTEVNYGYGLTSFLMACIDRDAFWGNTLASHLPQSLASSLPPIIANTETRHIGVSCWLLMNTVLVLLSIRRVLSHSNVATNKLAIPALCKFLTPGLLAISPWILPAHFVQNHTRYISVAIGLMMSLMTKKIIVFSMAKMNYASIQLDILPFMLCCLWIKYDDNMTESGAKAVMGALCLWHTWRLLRWSNMAIFQICEKLDIHCFSIKKKG